MPKKIWAQNLEKYYVDLDMYLNAALHTIL